MKQTAPARRSPNVGSKTNKKQETLMTRMLTRSALALSLVIAGAGVAAAAGTTTSSQAQDHLSLTSMQNKELFQAINKQKPKEQTAPSGFSATTGTLVPSSIALSPLPSDAAKQVPAAKSYDFAMLQNNKLLIVNPQDRKIVDVITQ